MKHKYVTKKALITTLMLCIGTCQSMAQPGSVDASFASGTGFTGNPNAPHVRTSLLLPDNKIIVGGVFSHYNGTAKNNLIRLNTDGTNDATFNIGSGFDEMIYSIARQSDGKLIVGGAFTQYDGASSPGIVRINTDGSRDATFTVGAGFASGKGPGLAQGVAIQSDGKIIVGGYFSSYAGSGAQNIVRLNANGTIDGSFTASTDRSVDAVVIQPDGKIIIAGDFSTVNGVASKYIARLNADGSIDNSFSTGTGFNDRVSTLLLQPDGKILAGGSFTTFNGSQANKIARLNANGTLDATFNTGTALGNDHLMAVALQPDGKIFLGGNFNSFNGTAAKSLVRINANGSVDTTFKTGTGFRNGSNSNGQIWQVIPQSDGKIIVGGVFTEYNVQTHNNIVRLSGYTPALAIESVSPTSGLCVGSKVAVTFETGIGSFNSGNVFTAQLSDASGNFGTPTNIGTLSGTQSGVITATIPNGVSAGSGYRIRIISSNPSTTGPTNGDNITIGSGTVPTLTTSASANTVCEGQQVTLTANAGGATITWDNGVTNNTPFIPTATKTYTATATSGGCSTSDQVTVTVNPLPTITATASNDDVCEGAQITLSASGASTYVWDNGVIDNQPFTINQSTTFTVTGTDANNCSNTEQISIKVREHGRTTINVVICTGDTYQLGSQTLTAPGTYTESFAGIAANGCDSIVTVQLAVAPDDLTVTREDQTLTANETNASYQWINCEDNSEIVGANNRSFTPILPGVFAVVVTKNGCADTSDCVPIWPASVPSTEGTAQVVLYPNPVRDHLTVKGNAITAIRVMDIAGKTIVDFSTDQPLKTYTIPTQSWHPGLYLVRIANGGAQQVYKIEIAR